MNKLCWSHSGGFKELCDNLINHIILFLDKPIDIKALSQTCKRLSTIVKNSPMYELAKQSDHCSIPINEDTELPNNQNTRNRRHALQQIKDCCSKTLKRSAICISSISVTILALVLWRTKQSDWITYIQQTMASKKDVQFKATDKFGKPVIFESVKIDPQSPECTKIIKSLSEIYAAAFIPTAKQLLIGYPEVVSTISHFKPFEPIVKKQGVEHINWPVAEEKMQAPFRKYFETKEVVLPNDTSGWFIIAKNKATASLLGFLQFSVSSSKEPGSINIDNFAFGPDSQHRGLGKLIMSSIFKFLPDTKKIYLRVLKTNTIAQKAYASYGFREYTPQQKYAPEDEVGPYTFSLVYKADKTQSLQKIADTLVQEKPTTQKN